MIEKEIAWDRVLLVGIAVLLGIFLVVVSVFFVISAVSARSAIQEPAGSYVQVDVPVPTPAWPDEVMKNVPASLPSVDPIPVILDTPFDEEKSGLRNMSEFFTIRRQNVSGYKSMTVKSTVYGVREYTQVKWYSDGYGKYLDQFAPPGEKYVFVFLAEYMDGSTQKEDPHVWYFPPGQFRLQVDRRLYDQDPDFVPTNRIKELEEIENFNKIRGISPFGFYLWQESGSGKKIPVLNPYLLMGQTNAVDGYLVYRVPENYSVSDMTLVGNFASFGEAAWRLHP
jgi:hypothetical protein